MQDTAFEQASVQRIFEQYGETLYKICIVMLKNTCDAEDAVQDVLIKYMVKKPVFDTDSYEKAWLIRVTMNLCKDRLRFKIKHPQTDIESMQAAYAGEQDEKRVISSFTGRSQGMRMRSKHGSIQNI